MIKLWIRIPCLMGYRLSRLLTHFFGPGLAVDNRKAVERCPAMAEGDTRHWPDAAPLGGGGRSAKAITTTQKPIMEMRPAPIEFIVCDGQWSPPPRRPV